MLSPYLSHTYIFVVDSTILLLLTLAIIVLRTCVLGAGKMKCWMIFPVRYVYMLYTSSGRRFLLVLGYPYRFNRSLSRVTVQIFEPYIILFSLHDTQYRTSEHAVYVRGAPTPVLTIQRLKAALSPLDIHSANRPNLIFSTWDMGITLEPP